VIDSSQDPANQEMKSRFLIIGAGAIGTYLGGSLALKGYPVTFLERAKDISRLQSRGITLNFQEQTLKTSSPEYISDLDQIKSGSYDLAILSIKTYHLKDLIPQLVKHKSNLPPILCLQNGVESEEKLAESIGDDLVISGTVTTAVDKNRKGDVTIRRLRGIGVGGNHPAVEMILTSFTEAGLKPSHYPRADSMKWSKLITNLLGNATSAILNMTPEDIYSNPGLFELEMNQIKEALMVMKLQHIPICNLPGIPVKLLAFAVWYLPKPLVQALLKKMVGGGRGGKMPSFHIDLHSGRGNCEVDQLNGAVVKAGERLNFRTPVNQILTNLLNDLVVGNQDVEKYDQQPDNLLMLVSHVESKMISN
jgi:2-dehydropantoate 2-reductase